MSFGYSRSNTFSQEYRSSVEGGSKTFQCPNCNRWEVTKHEDGTYICNHCQFIADIHETYEDVDMVGTQADSTTRSFRISQAEEGDNARFNKVVISEALQLILATQVVVVEKFLGVKIAAEVFNIINSYPRLLRPPVKESTFATIPLIVLGGLLSKGLPVTHFDIIHWITIGQIPYRYPLDYLPTSFVQRLSPAEQKVLAPKILNLHYFTVELSHEVKEKILPLPNVMLTLWRIASFLNVPQESFVSFCTALSKSKRIVTVPEINFAFGRVSVKQKTFKITTFIRTAYAAPLALAFYALCLIYRLDGTNWIHPKFKSIGFPPFLDLADFIIKSERKIPAFPIVSRDVPLLHSDLIKHFETADPLPTETVPIFVNDIEGLGEECEIPYEEIRLEDISNDKRLVLRYLSDAFGVSQLLIIQQFNKIAKKRFGYVPSRQPKNVL